MKYEIRSLSETALIGREGLCTKECNCVQELWKQTNEHFTEIAHLAKKTEKGTYSGFWGAMSDEGMSFQPWTDGFSRGLYLAGCEVNENAEAPEGWKKWILPARTYLITEVDMEHYSAIFRTVLNQFLAEEHLKLAGAVCDYTDPLSGRNYLYFPVEMM